MNNKQIAESLERIADLLVILGESDFRANAYRNAARRIENLTEPAGDLYARGKLTSIPGIGKGIEETIGELVRDARSDTMEQLNSQVPPGLLDVLRVPGLGPKRARALHLALGISTLADLEKAAKSGALASVPGFGAKTAETIAANLARIRTWSERQLLCDALPVAEELADRLKTTEGVEDVAVVGSIRRRRETVGDVDLLAFGADPDSIARRFALALGADLADTPPREPLAFSLADGTRVHLSVTTPDSWGTALVYSTGSESHTAALGDLPRAATEEEVYSGIGLRYIPAEIRENRGEIEAARTGRLPALVTVSDLKSDLHMHSLYSDGAASMEDMALACMARGYTYMAITDHSQGLPVANGLTVERLAVQAQEVHRLNAELAPFRILHGTEVNIRADGALDFPDEVLEKLDWVVASVHSAFGRSTDEQTERVIRALRHPFVNLIAHPTGRILNRREGISVDMASLIRAAAETGAALEINSGPDRLDLNDIHSRAARDAGVWICVDADAHHPDHLQWVDLGIATARRGWCETANVLNAQPLEAVVEFVKRKRMG
ncbi:MAG TPA: helix-hairpin-helix domain-containing protein [Armatimonadota bacterium]|jgi:DNA polymerase (family 10)